MKIMHLPKKYGKYLKNRGEYHDLDVQSDTLLLADVFENFRNMCLEIYELDQVYLVSALVYANDGKPV